MSFLVEGKRRYKAQGLCDTSGRLNRMQKGTFGEYFAKMEFAMFGFEVYTSEVDDRGIDSALASVENTRSAPTEHSMSPH